MNDGKDGSPAGPRDEPDLEPVVDALCEGARPREPFACAEPLPERDVLADLVEDLRAVLFPGYFGDAEVMGRALRFRIGSLLDRVRRRLVVQVKRAFCFDCTTGPEAATCGPRSGEAVGAFLARLPEIRGLLEKDVQAAWEGDPAAPSPDEAILCYPGLAAITNYRIAHALHEQGVPLLPRMIMEFAHDRTGIDIHPGAEIGESFFIDHGTGVVIGETCRIGRGVRLYQGVTLGAKSFPLDDRGRPVKGVPRHPVVEDDVVIYSGATILGRITIGRGAVIGGNVWVTRDVAPGAFVVQSRAQRGLWDQGGGI